MEITSLEIKSCQLPKNPKYIFFYLLFLHVGCLGEADNLLKTRFVDYSSSERHDFMRDPAAAAECFKVVLVFWHVESHQRNSHEASQRSQL